MIFSRMILPGLRQIALSSFLAIPSAMAGAWMDFDGQIPGEATAPGHEDWIEIEGFELEGILENVGGFSVRKALDKSSPSLFLGCAQGTRYTKVTLDLDAPGAGGAEMPLNRVELEDVLIARHETSGDSGGLLAEESLDLVFTKITYTYILPDSSYSAFDYDNSNKTGGITDGGPNPDSDNDGMPDSWEDANGLSVGINDAYGDLDGDGLYNIHEYELGTNPKSGSSFFKATITPDIATPGSFLLTWNSVVGKAYVIEWSPDLLTPFTTFQNHTATATSTTLSVGTAGSRGFFRVRPQASP